MAVLAILALLVVILLAGLILMVTYNNSVTRMRPGMQKLNFGGAIAFLFFVAMLGLAFLGWSKALLFLSIGGSGSGTILA